MSWILEENLGCLEGVCAAAVWELHCLDRPARATKTPVQTLLYSSAKTGQRF